MSKVKLTIKCQNVPFFRNSSCQREFDITVEKYDYEGALNEYKKVVLGHYSDHKEPNSERSQYVDKVTNEAELKSALDGERFKNDFKKFLDSGNFTEIKV